MSKEKKLFVLSPFELTDVGLALKTIEAGAFPIVHLGRDKNEAVQNLKNLTEKTKESFGVCFASESMTDIKLPENVTKVFLPYGYTFPVKKGIKVYHQVHSFQEAEDAVNQGAKAIVLKGNEGAGKVAYESSFVFFQGIKNKYPQLKTEIYLQGGMGIHTSAAALAMGAQGIIFDSQVALFPECNIPKELKNILNKLSGSETVLVDNFRFLLRKNSPVLPAQAKYEDIVPFMGGLDLSKNIIPVGQDISLSIDFVERYKNLENLVYAFHEAAYGHLQQARSLNTIGENSPLAKDLGLKYPIAQGPMARVSDIPEFAEKVTDEGGLPFIALSLMIGKAAKDTLSGTRELLKEKPWGVGILGFAPAQLREEQMKHILENKPPVLLIAGGRPSQAKPYEKEGIKVFLHVPSVALLDMFLKEGAKDFIFEGRESGGHVGPLSSMVLWEKQISRLLKEDNLTSLRVFFAGGIHDAFSSAFTSIMSATLAAKGAKIGVLMGTSYLFTEEAVETGAISDEYQKLSISHNKTVLLESAPGQETRALPTPFTDYFSREKERLFSEGLDSKEVWMKLEEMNMGRQRIAAKGIERRGKELVKLEKEEQIEKGVYMIGQVAALRNEATTIKELHTRVAVDNNKLISQLEKIPAPTIKETAPKLAIVGMAGIFPQSRSLEEYWRNILMGKDCVTEVPDTRWNKELFFNPNTRDTDYVYSKWGGFIPAIDFDPLEFGIPPQSLASIEPVQLLSLLVAKRALEDAGYDMKTFDGENTSVVVGVEGSTELAFGYGFRGYGKQVFGELPKELKDALPILNEDSFPGILSNVVAGRIANRLNLGGRNYTVDAACASSLAAMDIACQELQNKRSDIVIFGGSDLHNGLYDFLMFSSTYALSRQGRCASFDASADGITLGEGIGMIVLKRLEDAERDGDRIYAVIRGSGGSSDGKSLGMTAPNKKGQMRALQRAYKNSGTLPSEVELIEAHGTGTAVGDKTELNALTDMFLESGAVTGQTCLSSVKSQIGHAKCAAGVSGVIKAVLSTYYGIKPPIIKLSTPTSSYKKETSPFVFNTKATIWGSEKRIVGVSAFGFGGTNFHVVMENYQPEIPFLSTMNLLPSELFVFKGDNPNEAKQIALKVKNLLAINNSFSIKNIAYSLALYNEKEVQISIIAGDVKELEDKIDAVLADKEGEGIYIRDPKEGKVAFLFSGQGSQRIDMARELFVAFPSMRKLLVQNKEYENILLPHAVFDDESKVQQQKALRATQNAQPSLGIVDFAIADFLRSLGIEPDMVAGHSYGELPALCFAGVFEPEELVPLSRKRADAILEAVGDDKGKMIAVNLPDTELNSILAGEKDIWAVNFNSHKQTVLAGSTAAMTEFIKKLGQQNIVYRELVVDCAFHSPLLSRSKELYAEELKSVKFNAPTLPVWSNTTAEIYPSKANEIKKRLAEHLVKPVFFSKEVDNMYADGARIFIETGPGRVLLNLVQSILDTDDITTIQTEEREKEGTSFLLNAIAKYIATGRNINIKKLFEGRNVSVINIDAPEQYKKKLTNWVIDGHYAIPITGILPPHGALPITKPMNLLKTGTSSENHNGNLTQSDHAILEYLDNMKNLIQNQRDVMLTYLGQNPATAIAAPQTRNTTIEVPAHEVPARRNLQVNTQQQTIQSPTAVPQPVQQTTSAPGLSVEAIKETLLGIVSEKTGYPMEMLELDLDLEADLSIDSIKRMEIIGTLKDKLDITIDFEESEDAIEKIASIKTLNGFINWIEELANSKQAAKMVKDIANPVISESDTSVAAAPAPQNSVLSIEEIKTSLLETVSEKTGYPIEMLELDLDLEADLSIDSIKRMEIIGVLREKLNIPIDFEESEGAIEKMASIKTLNGVISWIEEVTNGNSNQSKPAPKTENHAKSAAIEAFSLDPELISDLEGSLAVEKKEEPLFRTLFELESYPIRSSEKLSISGKRFALTNDGKLAEAIKKTLEAEGAEVDIISGNETDFSSYDGLLILDASESPKQYTIKEAFTMIKQADTDRVKWIYFFGDIVGSLEGKEVITGGIRKIQGFSGLVKSLAREYSRINCRAIVSHSVFEVEQLSQIVLNELQTADISIEVVYKGSERFRYNLVPETITLNGHSNISLTKDSVVVVLGGAQGITAELVTQLSAEYPCHYILVGRSAKPTEEDYKYLSLKDRSAMRKYLISEEHMKNLSEIEKKVQKIDKTNHIINTISNIERSGSKVTYVSLDVTDEENLRKFIKDTYKQYGKIDGFIHAAGLLVDKLFVHKTIDAFEQVYSTKINPLHVILEELRPDVRFVVLFSSIASVYGSRGQSDYAAANSVLDLTAQVLNGKTETRILTINWGPWKGAGMVSSALESEYVKRGIALIPLKQGAREFINELKFGKDHQVLIMGGDDSGVKQFFGI
ncbi:MAG: SDR family NAD(P)-dependent oxidoreductase [Flavobacteriaceae bacterium]|jgi:acyl transferase domain-containing protein/NAD(P)H-dependent flavin oxidoreductase YrpB (nitropropane dioxygenase family)/NAD(P)-dependent dehydrogenase (short-subunit alcohol dehydrogenase family)|nr:SDR family NAD(P)-dependent oxidoreductase [Flavobacteriaceae bacterium]